MTKKKTLLSILVVIAIASLILIYNFYNKVYASNIKEDTTIYISSYAGFNKLVEQISPSLINKNSFIWVAEQKNYPKKIKAGY